MKKRHILFLAGVLSISTLVGCTSDGEVGDVVEEDEIVEEEKDEDIDLGAIHQAVKEEYGEDYIPSMEVSQEDLETMTGLDESHIESYIAEMPMINVNVDTFIAIQAKEGKAEIGRAHV